MKKLTAMHGETAIAVTQPKAQYRAASNGRLFEEAEGGSWIHSTSCRCDRLALVKLDDAMIDQLLISSTLAWIARNSAARCAGDDLQRACRPEAACPDAMLRSPPISARPNRSGKRWKNCPLG